MVLNLTAFLLVIGITFMNSIFGLYSGLLNVFCAIVALCVSLGFGEALNGFATGTLNLHASYTEPISYLLLFVVTLLALRLLADNYLRGNVRVPMYMDWAGGAVCGFVIAQICVGMMVICMIMLPIGGTVMMYQRLTRDSDNEVNPETGRAVFHENHLWFRSDEFAVSLFRILSSGSLEGTTTFASVYPKFTRWVSWTANQVQEESLTSPLRDKQGDGFNEGGLAVQSWWWQDRAPDNTRVVYRKLKPDHDQAEPPYEPFDYKTDAEHKLLGVRLDLKLASADRGEGPAFHRFRPTNIRVVGDRVLGASKTPMSFAPQMLGGADPRIGDKLRVVDPDNNFSIPATGETPLDAYFEVPVDFQPRFVEYRRHARAPLTGEPAAAAPKDRLALLTGDKDEGDGAGRGRGISRFIDAVNMDMTGDLNDRLPLKFARSKLTGRFDVDLDGDKLKDVQTGMVLSGFREDWEQGDSFVDKFAVPDGKRIFQFQGGTRKMGSTLGQALNFVAARTSQYFAVDRVGNQYLLAGYYVIVKKDGKDYFEFFFNPEPENTGFNGQLKFDDTGIYRLLSDQEDSVLGLLFVVPPGTCITQIKTTGGSWDFGREICAGG